MKSAGRPILAAIKNRGYAAAASAARAESGLQAQQAKVTPLPSGIVVASLENYSPVSRVSVLYGAGSRSEDGNTLGMNHALRTAVNLSTENKTAFGIVRNIQQIGGNLTCSTTREQSIYTVECLRNGLDTALEFLGEVSSAPAFNAWELGELAGRMRLDLAHLEQQQQVRLMEALHSAAFRTGLGRSLYAPANRIGSYDQAALADFVQKQYTSSNMAVVGLGIDHDQLVFAAKKLQVGAGGSKSEASQYYGGEIRIDEPGPLTSVAIVSQGVSLGSSDLLALGVLQQVMGTGPYVKYGSGVSASKVAKAAASGTNAPFAASAISASYSDAGIFGFQVTTQASEVAPVVKALVGAFSDATKGGITDADVNRAKNQLRAAVAMDAENGGSLLLSMGVEALVSHRVTAPAEVDAAISAITTQQVQQVAKKVINSGKPTMAAVGNLSNTPYLDQLL
jgi:ubiquinol-cytochrome c reductase core subunit 2